MMSFFGLLFSHTKEEVMPKVTYMNNICAQTDEESGKTAYQEFTL